MTATPSNRRAAALLNICWPAIVAACGLTGCGKSAATPGEPSTAGTTASQPVAPEDDAWMKQAAARLRQDRAAREQWDKQDGANSWVLPDHVKSEPPVQVTTNPADPLAPPPAPAPKSNVDYLKDFETRPVGSDANSDQPSSKPATATPGDSAAPKASLDGTLRSLQNPIGLAGRDAKAAVTRLKIETPEILRPYKFDFNDLLASKLEIVRDIGALESRLAIDPNRPAVEPAEEVEETTALAPERIQNFSFSVGGNTF